MMDEKDLTAVSHIQEFADTLETIGVARSEVCLFGSTTLALYGLRSNHDIDFIATSSARQKIRQFAKRDPNSKIIEGVRTHIGDHFELLVPDRLDAPPYQFGLDDETVITDPSYHVVVDGFRFVRPELVLSMKAAKRRSKDLDDIELIQESGLTDTRHWDWEYVFIVPPWERNFTTQRSGVRGRIERSLPYRALKMLISQGPGTMMAKTANFLKPKVRSFYRHSELYPMKLARIYEHGSRFRQPVVDDLDYRYPLPNLLARQYDDDGTFERYDLVKRLLASKGVDGFVSAEAISPPLDDIIVSSDGKLTGGVNTLASKLAEWSDDLPGEAPDKTVPVSVTPSAKHQPAPLEVYGTDEQTIERLRECKKQLLEKSGTAFYAILWPGIYQLFDEAESLVRSKANVIGTYEYEITETFAEFVRNVYDADKRNKNWFRDNKIAELQRFEPVIRVLVVEIPDPQFEISSGYPICSQGYNLKMFCRREFQDRLDDYVYGTGIHVTDNFQHNAHISHLLSKLEDDERVKAVSYASVPDR